MIVPMKKVFLALMDNEKEDALKIIRELGTLHLRKHTASSPTLSKHIERNNQIAVALRVLNSFTLKKGEIVTPITYDGDIVDYIIKQEGQRKALFEEIAQLQREQESLKKWNDFDPQSLIYLSNNGINLYYYELNQKVYNENIG